MIPILLAFGEITHFEGRGGGRRPNKGRYGYVASAKPRLSTISPKDLMPGQKRSAQKPNDQTRVPNLKIFSK